METATKIAIVNIEDPTIAIVARFEIDHATEIQTGTETGTETIVIGTEKRDQIVGIVDMIEIEGDNCNSVSMHALMIKLF